MTKEFQGNYRGAAAAFKRDKDGIELVVLAPDIESLQAVLADFENVKALDLAKVQRAKVVAA